MEIPLSQYRQWDLETALGDPKVGTEVQLSSLSKVATKTSRGFNRARAQRAARADAVPQVRGAGSRDDSRASRAICQSQAWHGMITIIQVSKGQEETTRRQLLREWWELLCSSFLR